MTNQINSMPSECPFCEHKNIVYKQKAEKWECQNPDCEERFSGPAPTAETRRLSDRATRPKSIFFSYGHDFNKKLVEFFQQDLEKRGHKVWIDFKEIGNWDDWKGSITRGIDSSHMAIAFISKHAIREPGVCRNEIAIAMNRFGTVYPVLLEEGIQNDVPVTIADLQWPDLSQWRDIHDGNIPEINWDRWYEEKLINLVEKIEGNATRFADETETLRKALDPASFEAKIAQHIPGFIGREWLFDAYSHWLAKQPESRLFWIKAGPGVGKSAIAANLAHRQRGTIAASWFCDAKSPERKNPDNALRSLAFQLALRWEDYRVKLLRQLQLGPNASDEMCDEAFKELNKKNTHDLFNHILAEPLSNLIWREHKLVVLVDALDEVTDEQGQNRITELIGNELQSLPDWLSFVVTSRPEAEVVNRLQGFKPFEISTQDSRNLADLRTWYQINLGQRPELSSLSATDQQHFEDLLIKRSEGMILYLKVIEEGFKEGTLSVSQLEHLEAGLPGLFRRYFDSFDQRFGNDYEANVKPLVRLLHAAGGALPEDLACTVLNWNSEQFLACRNKLGSYLNNLPEGYEFFHKTLGEWLSKKESAQFYLDRTLGQQQIADALFNEIVENEAYQLRWRTQTLSWLPVWLPELDQYQDAQCLSYIGSLFLDLCNFINAQLVFQRALKIRKAALPAGHPSVAGSISNLANLLDATGRYDEAELLYREALAIEKAALPAGHPSIAGSISNLASLLYTTGRYDEAEPLYREALAIWKAVNRPGFPRHPKSLKLRFIRRCHD